MRSVRVGMTPGRATCCRAKGDQQWHYQCSVWDVLKDWKAGDWELMIAHPPCTHLAVSGARWFKAKRESGEQQAALAFVGSLMDAPIERICIENPVSIISSQIRPCDQIVHPWMFGHGESKATCLWLKNLPPLHPTDIVTGREPRVHREPPGPDRWKNRSRTYTGMAAAMADQWGALHGARQSIGNVAIPPPTWKTKGNEP